MINKSVALPNCWKSCGASYGDWKELQNGKEIEVKDISFNSFIQDAPYAALEKTLRAYNVEIISHFLDKYSNNVMKVADKLDIGKSTIYNMMKSGEIINK